jgi:hypothetical protein
MRACDNPFAVHRVLRQRYRLDERGWSALAARLESLGCRGAIVGGHGTGKTTLLEDFAPRLEAIGWRIHWLRFNAEERSLPENTRYTSTDMIVCDGAEQLGLLDWLRLRVRAAAAGGFVITSHRAGRLPTLHRCETSAALLRDLAASLAAPIPEADGVELFARHGGNLRDAIREMYDRYGDSRRIASALSNAATARVTSSSSVAESRK